MRIISRRRLVEFCNSQKTGAAAEMAARYVDAWYKVARRADWANFGALRQTFGSADRVGNCVVFDVGNNRYRLIGRVNFARGIVYVLKVMDHAEYDASPWAEECGCHEPPPRKAARKGNRPPGGSSPGGPERER